MMDKCLFVRLWYGNPTHGASSFIGEPFFCAAEMGKIFAAWILSPGLSSVFIETDGACVGFLGGGWRG
jgi:hypothetical protein